jgi:hypothetical protein
MHLRIHSRSCLELIKDLFGRAPRVASRLNLGEALPNSFSERSDSMLILWSDTLK